MTQKNKENNCQSSWLCSSWLCGAVVVTLAMPIPSDQVLEEELKEALRSQNIEELSLKNLRAQLESKFEVCMYSVKTSVTSAILNHYLQF